MKPLILVIEDNPDVLNVIRALLLRRGYNVISATDGREGVAQFERTPVDLVITDVLMPNVDGIETICRIRKVNSTVPVVAISGGHEIEPEYYLRIASALGAARTLLKPFGSDQLFACVDGLLPVPRGDTEMRAS